jgi:hypothetical protein
VGTAARAGATVVTTIDTTATRATVRVAATLLRDLAQVTDGCVDTGTLCVRTSSPVNGYGHSASGLSKESAGPPSAPVVRPGRAFS